MKLISLCVLVLFFLFSCEPPKPPALLEKEMKEAQEKIKQVQNQTKIKEEFDQNWNYRAYTYKATDSLFHGNTYLAIYSEIYSRTADRSFPLTATVSIRNTSLQDSVFINRSEYYDTHGKVITTYFDRTIYVSPMETVEIIIAEDHIKGGSGGNFVFHWSSRNQKIKPLFDAVMVSASGQQGISITTHGIELTD